MAVPIVIYCLLGNVLVPMEERGKWLPSGLIGTRGSGPTQSKLLISKVRVGARQPVNERRRIAPGRFGTTCISWSGVPREMCSRSR